MTVHKWGTETLVNTTSTGEKLERRRSARKG